MLQPLLHCVGLLGQLVALVIVLVVQRLAARVDQRDAIGKGYSTTRAVFSGKVT